MTCASTPVTAFTRPLDTTTPMARVDFWLFYIGFLAAMTLVITLCLYLLDLAQRVPPMAALFLNATALIMAVYMIATLFSAMSRRMRDSRAWRGSLAIFIIAAMAEFALFIRDVLNAIPERLPAEPPAIVPSPATYAVMTIAALASIHILKGLIAPGRDQPPTAS